METLNLILTTIKTTKKIQSTKPIWYIIGFIAVIVGSIIVIKVMESEERKNDAQFDEIHYQSENFRLINSMMKESIKYYKINRVKNTIIFFFAIVACFLGLYITTFSSNLLDYIFGSITEFISATFFWLYKQCQKEEKYYYDRIFYLKKVLIAISLTTSSKSKKINVEKIIDILINRN